MKHLQKAPRKPLFTNENQAEIFINLFNDCDEIEYKTIAKLIFVDGLTNEETANATYYSLRSIERVRSKIIKIALKKAITLIQTLEANANLIKTLQAIQELKKIGVYTDEELQTFYSREVGRLKERVTPND